jgi:rRNA processing protein Gar1
MFRRFESLTCTHKKYRDDVSRNEHILFELQKWIVSINHKTYAALSEIVGVTKETFGEYQELSVI